MASTVTRSQSSQACLGCGGKGDSHHRRGADQSAATVWWCHANLDQNLWGMFRAHYWICATKAEWDTAWHQRGLPNKVVSGIKKHISHMKFSSFPNLNYITGNTGKDIDKSFKRHFPPIIQPFPPSAPSPVLWFMFFPPLWVVASCLIRWDYSSGTSCFNLFDLGWKSFFWSPPDLWCFGSNVGMIKSDGYDGLHSAVLGRHSLWS